MANGESKGRHGPFPFSLFPFPFSLLAIRYSLLAFPYSLFAIPLSPVNWWLRLGDCHGSLGATGIRKLAAGGAKMGPYRAVIACLLTVALVACATVPTTTPEPQNKQRDPQQARLYFIWPRGWTMKTGTLDIKVNGEVAGKIAPDSYFFVDRKPVIR
jgi:hypothetical protein